MNKEELKENIMNWYIGEFSNNNRGFISKGHMDKVRSYYIGERHENARDYFFEIFKDFKKYGKIDIRVFSKYIFEIHGDVPMNLFYDEEKNRYSYHSYSERHKCVVDSTDYTFNYETYIDVVRKQNLEILLNGG